MQGVISFYWPPTFVGSIKERYGDSLMQALYSVDGWLTSLDSRRLTSCQVAAKAYLKGFADPLAHGSVRGMTSQVAYLLNNIKGWRGEEARLAREAMQAFLKRHRASR